MAVDKNTIDAVNSVEISEKLKTAPASSAQAAIGSQSNKDINEAKEAAKDQQAQAIPVAAPVAKPPVDKKDQAIQEAASALNKASKVASDALPGERGIQIEDATKSGYKISVQDQTEPPVGSSGIKPGEGPSRPAAYDWRKDPKYTQKDANITTLPDQPYIKESEYEEKLKSNAAHDITDPRVSPEEFKKNVESSLKFDPGMMFQIFGDILQAIGKGKLAYAGRDYTTAAENRYNKKIEVLANLKQKQGEADIDVEKYGETTKIDIDKVYKTLDPELQKIAANYMEQSEGNIRTFMGTLEGEIRKIKESNLAEGEKMIKINQLTYLYDAFRNAAGSSSQFGESTAAAVAASKLGTAPKASQPKPPVGSTGVLKPGPTPNKDPAMDRKVETDTLGLLGQ